MSGVSHERIEAALTARLDFDALNTEERAVALARLDQLELTRRAPPMLPAAGALLYERDARGRLVSVSADRRRRRIGKRPKAKSHKR